MDGMRLITVAIPCYRSAATLPQVTERIRNTIRSREGCDYQIILVDDSPQDTDTFPVIRELCEADPKITGVRLTRNYGQQAAKMAALPYAKGDVLVYMDDDGQHPPEELFKLVDKLDEGYDMVFARFSRKHHSLFKRVTSAIRTQIAVWLGNQPKGLKTTAYQALSRVCIDALRQYESPFPIMAPYIFLITTNIVNVEIDHRDRLAGKSGYTLRKLVSLWLSLFTNFSIAPLRISAVLGMLTALGGFVYMIVITIQRILNPNILPGYSSIMIALLLIGGVLMMMLGLVGEYLGRVYMTVSNKPQYFVRTVLNDGGEPPEKN